jgi:hypothetical protein
MREAQISQGYMRGVKHGRFKTYNGGRMEDEEKQSDRRNVHYLKRPKRRLSHTRLVLLVIARRASDLHWLSKQDRTRERGSDPADFRSIGSRTMAEVTYFVALPFVISEDDVAAGEPTECLNPNAVVMRAEALARKEGHGRCRRV